MKDATDITMVLDRSGSMGVVRDDTIGGFNAFVDDQKKVAGEARLTLVQFDHEYEVVYDAVALGEVPLLDYDTYVPRGSTALLDALGRTITATGARLAALAEGDRPSRVIFVILTDGQENASKEFGRDRINEMIIHQTNAFNWAFVFLGANQDAIREAGRIGIFAANALTYAADERGTGDAFAAASRNLADYRVSAPEEKAADLKFFNEDDRKKQKRGKRR